MNVVVAIDSFKGSLSSLEAGEACARGIKKANPGASVTVMSLADGGEGTVSALTDGMGGSLFSVEVCGPLKDKVTAVYGIAGDIAIIEMSAAAGITLIPENKRNPLKTTTYGVGQIIKDAISRGCRKFIVGIGGSATNDGGVGMLQALGYEFKDSSGKDISFGAEGLKDIASVSSKNVIKELEKCEFRVACDVDNPLCGPKGCSAVFGPQKGANESMVLDMDLYLEHYSAVSIEYLRKPDKLASYPGAGAAGGLGFAFLAYLGAKLESGISIVLDEIHLEDYVKSADIVVTGEGRLDSQTVMGKAPVGVAKLAKKYGKKVIAFSGCVTDDAGIINEHGIDAFFPIIRGICTREEAMDVSNAAANLSAASEQVFRLI